MKPSYILTSDFVTIVYNGSPQTVGREDIRYTKIIEIIRLGDWDRLSDVLELRDFIKKFSCGRVELVGEIIQFNGRVVNNCITQRIVEFLKNDIPFEPLMKFMDKLMDNPSNRSVEQLYKHLELYKLPITDDGDFVAFKSVRHDMTDHHTGKVDNSVGAIPEMNRNEVSDDPACPCHSGLHVASLDYIKSLYRHGVLILCKINPRDVVSIPHDHNFQKMRVCRYEVVNIVGNVKDSKDFDSNYAPENAQTVETVADASIPDGYVKVGADRAFHLYKMEHNVCYMLNGVLNNVENSSNFMPHRSWFRALGAEFFALSNK